MIDPRAVAGLRSVLERLPGERIGWKIGLNVPAVQQRLGIEERVAGVLTTATLVERGSAHSLAGATNPVAEPEVAIEIGADGEIASLAPAIEIADIDLPFDDVEAIVGRNVFHRAVVLGEPVTDVWLDGVEARMFVNGEPQAAVDAAEATGNLAEVVDVIERNADAAGAALRPGDRIIAGSMTVPVRIEPGDVFALDLGPLGSVEVELTS